jgi:hypothetical protein
MIASGRFEMAVIRRAGKPDEMVILNLWTRLIEYHRSIEAFRPERWKIPPEDAIRPLLTTAWELPESHAAFVAQSAGKVFGFVYMGVDGTRPLPCQDKRAVR